MYNNSAPLFVLSTAFHTMIWEQRLLWASACIPTTLQRRLACLRYCREDFMFLMAQMIIKERKIIHGIEVLR